MNRRRMAIGLGAAACIVVGALALRPAGGKSALAAGNPTTVYSAKFLCGQPGAGSGSTAATTYPVQYLRYATSINVENPNSTAASFTKFAIADYSTAAGQGAQSSNEQGFGRGKPVTEALNPDAGMEIDCADIANTLLAGNTSSFIEGWITITPQAPAGGPVPILIVSAVYSSVGPTNQTATAPSVQVVPIQPTLTSS